MCLECVRQGGGEWLRLWKRRAWALRVLRGRSRTWAWRRLLESRAQREARLAAATLSSTGRLVFVCHGNIMRSAFATQVARAHVPAAAARIVGAGTHATAGRSAQDAALEVSRTMALPLDGHAATPLHALSLTGSDVVVCMDALNRANVLASYPALAPVCSAWVTLVPVVKRLLRSCRTPIAKSSTRMGAAYRPRVMPSSAWPGWRGGGQSGYRCSCGSTRAR